MLGIELLHEIFHHHIKINQYVLITGVFQIHRRKISLELYCITSGLENCTTTA
jgi:hypothetical protein